MNKEQLKKDLHSLESIALTTLAKIEQMRRNAKLHRVKKNGYNPSRIELKVVELVCDMVRLDPEKFWEECGSRKRAYHTGRAFAAMILRDEFEYSYPAIARLFQKDHASIMHSYEVAEDLMITDPDLKRDYLELVKRFRYEPNQ